ncbi:MAG: arsenate reductase ArsC, partial [Devosia sp.]
FWPGHPMSAHWGIEDPAAVEGPDFKRRAAFEEAMRYMKNRIEAFINLPLSSIDRMTLGAKLHGIGRMDGSSHLAPQLA